MHRDASPRRRPPPRPPAAARPGARPLAGPGPGLGPCLGLLLAGLALLLPAARAHLNVYLTPQEVRTLLGVQAELFYVREGVVNEYALNFQVPVPPHLGALHFAWQSLAHHPLQYSLAVELGGGAAEALGTPALNVSHAGLVPTAPQVFRVTLPCTGRVSAEVNVTVAINVTLGPGNVTSLAIRRRKFCQKGDYDTDVVVVMDSAPEGASALVFYVAMGCACAVIAVIVAFIAVYYVRSGKARRQGEMLQESRNGSSSSAQGHATFLTAAEAAAAAAAAAAALGGAAAAGPSGERAGGGGGGGRARRDNRTLPKHHLRERPARGWATGAGAGAAARRRSASQPRFPQPQPHSQADGWAPRCDAGDSAECGPSGRASPQPPLDEKLAAKVASYKAQLVVQLRRVLLDEGSVFRAGGRGAAANPYHVNYAGPRGSYAGRTARELVCELHQAAVGVRTLRPQDQPFRRLGLGARFPAAPLLPPAPGPAPAPATAARPPTRRQRACAVVSNAGALAGSGLGAFIDKHDLVLRFNHAPTINYEHDVGTKTTIRIVNSQVVSKPEFDFLNSPLYEDVALLVWDPSNYSATLEEWYANPDFDLFTPYFLHRELHPERNFHVLDPRSLWALWEFIQSHIPIRIRKNPPSSGFLGLALLLPHCAYVDLFEYVPSMRLTKRCHYWEAAEDLSCTFGVWHPLAAEKLLALALNVANDQTVYTTGYIRVLGYDTLRC